MNKLMEFLWAPRSLEPVLANIILTEFEKLIVFDLVDSGLIKFYRR